MTGQHYILGLLAAGHLLTPGASAASVSELIDDRVAVERVYYARQLGTKPAFEAAMPRAAIERKVQQELLKESVLKSVYGIEISPAMVQQEVERIQKTSLAPEALKQLQTALGNDPERFARAVVRPLVVDRVLRERFAADAAAQTKQRQAAEALRAELLAAKPEARAALLNQRGDVRPVKWLLGAPPPAREKTRRASAAPAPRDAYFAELHPQMQRVLDAQLQQPGDVSAVFGSDAHFAVYVATGRSADALSVLAIEIPCLTFDAWLAGPARAHL